MIIQIESNTYAYVIIRGFVLKPYESGSLDDTGLLKSEYKSLVSLYEDKAIFLSASDYAYLKGKVGESTGGGPYDDTEIRALLSEKVSISEIGVVGGVAPLDSSGRISSTNLPSYVDDVIEVNGISNISSGEADKIYIDTVDNLCYRWGGSSFVKITTGEVTSVAGMKGVVVLTKSDVGLSNVDNTSDATKEVLSATKLKTPVTVSITGDATGSSSFTGNTATSVNISLKDSGVVAGDYGSDVSVPVLTFTNKGLVSSATSSPIRVGSTTQTGILQLNDTLASSSTSLALTANQGKVLKDSIDSLPLPSVYGLGSSLHLPSDNTLENITLENSFWSKGSIPLPSDAPFSAAFKFLNIGNSAWNTQLCFAAYSNTIKIRSRTTSNGSFFAWDELALVSNVILKTDSKVSSWDAAATASHSHSNKSILDGTTASYTTDLDTKLQGLTNYTHPNSGVTAGTYKSVTINALGHVTSGTNPTTLSGYGITNAYTKTEMDATIGNIQTALSTILGDV